MEPSFDFWSALFLVASLQGLVLSILIWRKQHQANKFLALVILGFSLMLSYYVSFWTGYAQVLPRFLGVLQGMTYLIGPWFYGYLLSDQWPETLDWKHFFLAVIYPIYFLSVPELVSNHQWLITAQNLIQVSHLLAYAGLSVRVTRRQSLTSQKWKPILTYLFTGYALSFLTYYVLVWTGKIRLEYDYFISFFSTGFIYFIGYCGYEPKNVFQVVATRKYDKSGLSQNAAESILKAVKKYMETEKGFLNNDLKLQRLADDLSISSNHISRVINELEGCNFHDFVNRYRVEEAKKLLSEDSDRYKIIQIAYMAGFNNKATFNSAFKKFVGIPPSQFRKSIL
ncbi:MAG: AraC family transcriptional regulator [Cyclobacteriaceae bacterium]